LVEDGNCSAFFGSKAAVGDAPIFCEELAGPALVDSEKVDQSDEGQI
jgi:hypothetical protein